MYYLNQFTSDCIDECALIFQQLCAGSKTMKEAVTKISRHLHENVVAPDQTKAFVFIGFYKSHSYEQLSPDLQEFFCKISGSRTESPQLRCILALRTSDYHKTEWEDLHIKHMHQQHNSFDFSKYLPLLKNSHSHWVPLFPLKNEKILQKYIFFTHMLQQFGIDANAVISLVPLAPPPQPLNGLYISEALGNLYLTMQKDFVINFGIKSIIGFGGIFPSGDFFAMVMYSRVFIRKETAEIFNRLATSVYTALLPFTNENFGEGRIR